MRLDTVRRTRQRAQTLEPGEVAWLALPPCAALVVLAIALLGPPLGHALFEPGSDRFWPEALVTPEPVEHARFVIALLGAPLVAGVVLAGARRRPRLQPRMARLAVGAAQAGTVSFLALMLLAQRNVLLRGYLPRNATLGLFGVPAIVAAAALALSAAAVLRRVPLVERVASAVHETRTRRVSCLLLAVLLAVAWLSSAFNTETTIGNAEANHLVAWDMSETFAVLDGRTPLADFHSEYAQLLPYLAALPMRLVGTSVGAWTAIMLAFSGCALLAVYALLRRLVVDSPLALALFVPFLAGSFYAGGGNLSPVAIFSVWPMRYAGPYVLAWLTVRQLDGAAPRRRWLLLGAGGLVAINNVEFGLPALGATTAALAYADPPRSRRAALRLLGDLAAGLLAAAALVAALTLAAGGALPSFPLLLEFPRIYGLGGWVLAPMASAGFHLVLYATFLAAVVVATVRAVRCDADSRLTGLLVWSGVFGLGAASYFAGRSDVINLIALFSTWCYALMLLTVVVVRALAATGAARRATLPELAVLFGCGLALTTVASLPLPWTQVARLQQRSPPIYKQADAVALVRASASPGERVAILASLGHRIAYDAGVVDVAPYASDEAMPTVGQMARTLEAMRTAAVRHVLVDSATAYAGQLAALTGAGYEPVAQRDRYLLLTNGPSD
jgi:hypothetical protein